MASLFSIGKKDDPKDLRLKGGFLALLVLGIGWYAYSCYRDHAYQATAETVQATVIDKYKTGRRARKRRKVKVEYDQRTYVVRVGSSTYGSVQEGDVLDLKHYANDTLHFPSEDHTTRGWLALGGLVLVGFFSGRAFYFSARRSHHST